MDHSILMKAESAQESVSKSSDWDILQINDLNNLRKGYVMMTYPFYYSLICFFTYIHILLIKK